MSFIRSGKEGRKENETFESNINEGREHFCCRNFLLPIEYEMREEKFPC